MASQFDHHLHHSGQYNPADDYHAIDDDFDEGWASDEFDACYESTEDYEQQNFIQRSPVGHSPQFGGEEEEENIYDMPEEEDHALQLPPRQQKLQAGNHKMQHQQQTSPTFAVPNSVNQSGSDRQQLVDKQQQHGQDQENVRQNSFANTRNIFEQSKPQTNRYPPVSNKKPQVNMKPRIGAHDSNNNSRNVSTVSSGGRPPMTIPQHQPNEDSGYNEDNYIVPEAEIAPNRIPRAPATHDCHVEDNSPVEIISSKPRNITGQEFIEQMQLRKLSSNNQKPQFSSKPPSQPKPANISRPFSSRPPACPTAQDTYEIAGQPPQLPLGRPPVPLPIQEPVQENYEVAGLPQKPPIGRPPVPLPPQEPNQELYEIADQSPMGRRPMPLPFQNPVQENYEVAGQPSKPPLGRPFMPLPTQEPMQENYEVAGQPSKPPLGRPPMPLPTQEPMQENYEVTSQPKLPGSRPPMPIPKQEFTQENYEIAGQPLKALSGRPQAPLPTEDTFQSNHEVTDDPSQKGINEANFQTMRDRPLPNTQQTIQDEYEAITLPQVLTPKLNPSSRNSSIPKEYNPVKLLQQQILGQPQPAPQLPARQESPRRVSAHDDKIVDRTVKKGNPQMMRPSMTPTQQISPKHESRPSLPIVPTGLIPKTHPHPPRRTPDPPQPSIPPVPSRSRPSSLKDSKPPHPLAKYNWFKPEMDRKACEQYLNRSKRNGDFVVRNSSKADALYSISIYHDKTGVRNLQLISKEGGKIHLGSSIQGFDSVPDLINFHQTNSIILNTGGEVTLIKS